MGLVALTMDWVVLEGSFVYVSHWEAQTISNYLPKP